jgi:hypothetical protein
MSLNDILEDSKLISNIIKYGAAAVGSIATAVLMGNKCYGEYRRYKNKKNDPEGYKEGKYGRPGDGFTRSAA